MDGKGRAIDNIFIERLWKSVKYECIYLNVFEDGVQLYRGLDDYFNFYNTERFHQSLDYETPESLYKKAAWVINKLTVINKKKKVAKKKKFTSTL